MKVTLTSESLKALATLSRQVGTTEKWIDLALEWIEQADEEINRLTELLDDKKETKNVLTRK